MIQRISLQSGNGLGSYRAMPVRQMGQIAPVVSMSDPTVSLVAGASQVAALSGGALYVLGEAFQSKGASKVGVYTLGFGLAGLAAFALGNLTGIVGA